jgi:hypothetical protein
VRIFTLHKPGEHHPSFGAVGNSWEEAMAAGSMGAATTREQVLQQTGVPNGQIIEEELEPRGTLPLLGDVVYCRFTFRRGVIRQVSPNYRICSVAWVNNNSSVEASNNLYVAKRSSKVLGERPVEAELAAV